MQLKAIQTNKGVEYHIAGLYRQRPRMIFLVVKELLWGWGVGGRLKKTVVLTFQDWNEAFHVSVLSVILRN